jgi:hypothetical protein
MFLHVTEAKHIQDYRLWLAFNNGEAGEVNLEHELWGEVFEPLRDKSLFATAFVDGEMKTLAWANGADLAPEFLLDLLHSQGKRAA